MASKFWSAATGYIDNKFGDDSFDYNDLLVTPPCTLLRTMIWVNFAGYNLYNIGNSNPVLAPVGYAFGDLNSRNNDNAFPPTNSPGNAKTELIAYDTVTPSYAAIGWPPNVTSTVSGSINDINSSGTVHETWNLNTFMYSHGRSFVDSQAQRIFDTTPTYSFRLLFFGGFGNFVNGRHSVFITIRQLYKQS